MEVVQIRVFEKQLCVAVTFGSEIDAGTAYINLHKVVRAIVAFEAHALGFAYDWWLGAGGGGCELAVSKVSLLAQA